MVEVFYLVPPMSRFLVTITIFGSFAWKIIYKGTIYGVSSLVIKQKFQRITPKNTELRQKWNIKSRKALFTLHTFISKEYIEHICDVKSLKQVWKSLEIQFTKKNTMQLQYLENELTRMTQGSLSIEEC